MDQEDFDFKEEQRIIEQTRRKITTLIAGEMVSMVMSLLEMANNPEEDSKVRLSAINSLFDRFQPKVGIEHAEKSEIEESGGSKSIRLEIESLIKELKEEDGEDD